MRVTTTHTLANGNWSTQAKVEGIVLIAARHLGSDSSAVNDPLGEPGHTPLYAGLQSAWDSVVGDRMFSPYAWEGSLTGGCEGYK
jgi:hypothetical protein